MAKTRALQKKAAQYPTLVVRELDTLEKQLGGRQALVSLLSLAPLTKDLQYVLGLLGDPQNQQLTLASICAQGNLLPGDLLKYLGAAALHRGQTIAKKTIGEHLPAVVADLMKKAAPYRNPCYGCQGTGSTTPEPTPDQPNPSPQPCETCNGVGELIYQPQLEVQRLAIEMGGLSQKGGGIAILNQQLNLPQAGSAGAGALEQLQSLTDQILYGEAVDAEFTPVEETAAPDPAGASGENPG